MFWIFGFLILFGGTFEPLVHSKFQTLALELQNNCASWIPSELIHRSLSQSFLCGTPLQNHQHKSLFRDTSLIHLMVVSGGHLQIISLFFLALWPAHRQSGTLSRGILLTLLFAYCLLTGLQAPVLRSFFSLILRELSHWGRWHWDSGKSQMFTGLWLLLLIPSWIFSFSFYLSWLASLGFLLSPLVKKESSSNLNKWFQFLLACFVIQALLSVSFGTFNAFGVLINSLLAPLLGLLLLPVSLLPCLIPSLSGPADSVWQSLIYLLQWIQSHLPETQNSFVSFSDRFWAGLWIFLAGIHALFEGLRRLRFRSHHV